MRWQRGTEPVWVWVLRPALPGSYLDGCVYVIPHPLHCPTTVPGGHLRPGGANLGRWHGAAEDHFMTHHAIWDAAATGAESE